jgi:hypothetical protein
MWIKLRKLPKLQLVLIFIILLVQGVLGCNLGSQTGCLSEWGSLDRILKGTWFFILPVLVSGLQGLGRWLLPIRG